MELITIKRTSIWEIILGVQISLRIMVEIANPRKLGLMIRAYENLSLGGGISNILYVHSYLGKIPMLTHIFQSGWELNHQLASVFPPLFAGELCRP